MSLLPVPLEVTSISLSGVNLTFVAVVGCIALLALVMAMVFRREVLAAADGTPNMQSIARAVQEGASAYLGRQFRTLSVFAVAAFFLLLLLPVHASEDFSSLTLRISRSVAFLAGAVFSALIGYLGMWLAVRANVRVAAAARSEGRDPAMKIAFRTGAHVGMATVGLGLFGAALVVFIFRGDAPTILEGFGFGAAMLAMFMRVGGGIFTKAADVGADLVGKVEQNIPEDDPRNAATIADNVGDNVGDCAGMAADLFESYAVTLVASLILGRAAFGEAGLVFPLIVPAIGVITAIIGVFLTRPRAGENGLKTINRSFYLSAAISAVLVAVAAFAYLPSSFAALGVSDVELGPIDDPRIIAIGAVVIGIVLAVLILSLTGYYTGTEDRPVNNVGKTSLTGAATVVLSGISVGLESAVYTALVIAAAVYGAFLLGGSGIVGLFAIALAGCGLLTTVGVIVAMDTFGPVSDNAQGIAWQHHQGHYQRNRDRHCGACRDRPVRLLHRRDQECVGRELWQVHRAGRGLRAANLGGPAAWRRCRLLVLRPRNQRSRSRGRGRGVRGTPPVPRDPWDHGGHRETRIRQGRRHLHQGFLARAGNTGTVGHMRPGCRWIRPRGLCISRLPGRRHCRRHIDGGFPRELRGCLGQRQETGRGRSPRWQGFGCPCGDSDRGHRRRPVQGHRRTCHQPVDQSHEPGIAADRAGGRCHVAAQHHPECLALCDRGCGGSDHHYHGDHQHSS
ncbi:MAG: hppA [Propionibacteriaceae bacterium]|nr:hppA [Propionibacteriaceae bacterium]